jgi:hypothetical protein
MATKTTTKSGNWSDPTVWGGALPQAGDAVVIASNHIITLDQSTPNLLSLAQHEAATGYLRYYHSSNVNRSITATTMTNTLAALIQTLEGGSGQLTINCPNLLQASWDAPFMQLWGLTPAAVVNINADIKGGGGQFFCDIQYASTLNINGNIDGWMGCHAIQVNEAASGATINVIGHVNAGSSGAHGMDIRADCTINITGDVNAGYGYGSHGINAVGIQAVITINGNVTGGDSSSYGVYLVGPSIVTITGNVTGGVGDYACGIASNGMATISVVGDITGGSLQGAVGITVNGALMTGVLYVTGNILDTLQARAIEGPFKVKNLTTTNYMRVYDDADQAKYFALEVLASNLKKDVHNGHIIGTYAPILVTPGAFDAPAESFALKGDVSREDRLIFGLARS